jgi:hypothetical protein
MGAMFVAGTSFDWRVLGPIHDGFTSTVQLRIIDASHFAIFELWDFVYGPSARRVPSGQERWLLKQCGATAEQGGIGARTFAISCCGILYMEPCNRVGA